MIRILIVSDYPVVRAGLQSLLEPRDHLSVVAAVSFREDIAALVQQLRPDLVLVDHLPEDDSSSLAKLSPSIADSGMIVLSSDASSDFATRVLNLGVRGLLLKDASPDEIVAAIHAVHQGLLVLHPALASALTPLIPRATPADKAAEQLTARELEVLSLVAQGLPNKLIAARLHLSEHTVKFHLGSIMGKLGASSRTQAVSLAAQQGLISL